MGHPQPAFDFLISLPDGVDVDESVFADWWAWDSVDAKKVMMSETIQKSGKTGSFQVGWKSFRPTISRACNAFLGGSISMQPLSVWD